MPLRDEARADAAAKRPVHPPAGRDVRDALDPAHRFSEPPADEEAPSDGVYVNTEPYTADLPEIDYTGSHLPVTAPDAPVQIAWAAVMAEVQQVQKLGKFSAPGAGTYNFRGIDLVMNAVGPALRKHRVMVIPTSVTPAYRDVVVGAKRTPMRECTVTVTYRIHGPRGDFMDAMSAGECLDSGDKGTTKACTVAYRNLLITALTIPTNNPNLDADRTNYQRAEAPPPPMPTANELRDEILRPNTSRARLSQIYAMIHPQKGDHPALGQTEVIGPTGDEIRLASLAYDLIQERKNEPEEN